MRILPVELIKAIQNFDRSIDIFWNGRLHRWVVVQKLPGLRRTGELLLGCANVNQEKTPYKGLFICEQDPPGKRYPPGKGIPVEPGGWIIRHLAQNCPTKPTEREMDIAFAREEEREDRETNRLIDDAVSATRSDLMKYAVRKRRHILT